MAKASLKLFLLFSFVCWIHASHVLDYDDQTTWGDTCVVGDFQSPIDFPDKSDMKAQDNIFVIKKHVYTPISNEYLTVYHDYKYMVDTKKTGSSLFVKYNGINYKYDLIDIHFHFKSEHTILSESLDIEMHMVHVKDTEYIKDLGTDPDAKHQYLVIGIMFKAADVAENSFISQLHFDTKKPLKHVDLARFVDTYKSYYYYQGSLTTPKCDEAVHWVVMEHIELMSLDQNETIVNWIKEKHETGNARETLPINGRTIYYVNPLNKVKKDLNKHMHKHKNNLRKKAQKVLDA